MVEQEFQQKTKTLIDSLKLTLIRSPGNFFEYYINSWRGPRSFG